MVELYGNCILWEYMVNEKYVNMKINLRQKGSSYTHLVFYFKLYINIINNLQNAENLITHS